MGVVIAELELSNPRAPQMLPCKVAARVDTGAMTLCIPEHIAVQLSLGAGTNREVTTADGRKQLVRYVGPIEIRFANRSCYVGAQVLGDEVLLGVVPMEDMDLIVCPSHRQLVVHPGSPNFPQALVK